MERCRRQVLMAPVVGFHRLKIVIGGRKTAAHDLDLI